MTPTLPTSRLFSFVGSLLPIVWLAATPLHAHPFHASLAEVEWNAETGCLEVAVRVNPDDLETTLREAVGKRIVLERESEASLDHLLAQYVTDSFRVTPRNNSRRRPGEPIKPRWVGYELTTRYVWLYFELPAPVGTTALDIEQTMFVESVPRQVNTVTLRLHRWTGSVHCTATRPTQTLALPAPLRRPK